MKKNIIYSIIVLTALSPLGYLWATWRSIQETFILKFEFNNSFERIQNKEDLLIAVFSISVASVLLYLLMHNLKKVDPKVDESTPQSSFHKLGLIITLFLAIMNYFLILSSQKEWIINTNVGIGFFSTLIIFMGNYMNNLRQNYFAGIRLPWTLSDAENWRRTHQLAAKLWFSGGIMLLICCFLMSADILRPLAIVLLIVLVVIPGTYSYMIFRNKVKSNT